MQNIEWIFFDMGGVILNDDEVESLRQQAILKISQSFGHDVALNEVQATWWDASATIGSVWKNTLKLLLPDTVLEQAQTKFLELVPNGTYANTIFVRPEAKEVLEIWSKKYNLGIIANQSASVTEKLVEADILKYFSHQKVSAHHSLGKPDPAYFASVLHDTGADPNKSVLVDDNWPRGLLPAKKLGMTTVLYKRDIWEYPQTQAEYIVHNLRELLGIF